MMTVEVRAADVLGVLKNGQKRIAYAVVNALNKSIRDVQKAEREGVLHEFTVRKREFVERQVAVIGGGGGEAGFARVASGRFEARVRVGQKQRLLLSAFERGGTRVTAMRQTGAVPVGKRAAVPIVGGPARPTFAQPVPSAFTFKGLRLRKGGPSVHASKRKRVTEASGEGRVQFTGAQRTFVVQESARTPEGGVFQRVGTARGDVRIVYAFKREQRLAPRLGFERRAAAKAATSFPYHLRAEVAAALAFAARRGLASIVGGGGFGNFAGAED